MSTTLPAILQFTVEHAVVFGIPIFCLACLLAILARELRLTRAQRRFAKSTARRGARSGRGSRPGTGGADFFPFAANAPLKSA